MFRDLSRLPQATKSAYVLLPVTCLRRKDGALDEMFGREQGMTMTQADSYFHAGGYAQPPESVGYGAMFAGMQNQMEVSPLFQALDDSSQLFLFQSSTTLLLFQAPCRQLDAQTIESDGDSDADLLYIRSHIYILLLTGAGILSEEGDVNDAVQKLREVPGAF